MSNLCVQNNLYPPTFKPDVAAVQTLPSSFAGPYLAPTTSAAESCLAAGKVGLPDMYAIGQMLCKVRCCDLALALSVGGKNPLIHVSPDVGASTGEISFKMIAELKHVVIDKGNWDPNKLLFLALSPSIESLETQIPFPQQVWEAWGKTSKLKDLELPLQLINEGTIQNIARLTKLETLRVRGEGEEEQVIALIERLYQYRIPLNHLDLSWCYCVTDKTIQMLEKCYPQLLKLNLKSTKVTHKTMHEGSVFWDHCELNLDYCFNLCPLAQCPPNVTMTNCGVTIRHESMSNGRTDARLQFLDSKAYQMYASGAAKMTFNLDYLSEHAYYIGDCKVPGSYSPGR